MSAQLTVEPHDPKIGFDPKELRAAFGQFATGITVVTTCTKAGGKVGLTVNSFPHFHSIHR